MSKLFTFVSDVDGRYWILSILQGRRLKEVHSTCVMDRSSTSLLVSVLCVASVTCAAPVTHINEHMLPLKHHRANESLGFSCIQEIVF